MKLLALFFHLRDIDRNGNHHEITRDVKLLICAFGAYFVWQLSLIFHEYAVHLLFGNMLHIDSKFTRYGREYLSFVLAKNITSTLPLALDPLIQNIFRH